MKVLLGAAIAAGGCATRRCPHACQVVVPDDPAVAYAIEEISAAGRLDFDAHRTEALSRIARRDGLPPVAQVHLVNTVLGSIAFSSSQEQVLLAMIGNPAFSLVARRCLLARLDELAFDNTRARILKALDERPPLEPASAPAR